MGEKKKPRRHAILKLPRGQEHGDAVCSFCGRGADSERRLLAGAAAYICSECIRNVGDRLREKSGEPPEEA